MSVVTFTIRPTPGYLVTDVPSGYSEYLRKIGAIWVESLGGWWCDDLVEPSLRVLQSKIERTELPPLNTLPISTPLPVPPIAPPRPKKPAFAHWSEDVRPDGTRKNKPWTPEEEDELLMGLRNGKTPAVLANYHLRSASSLESRLATIVARLTTEGLSDSQIMEQTNLTLASVALLHKRASGQWRSKPDEKIELLEEAAQSL